jgi:hypothetical protein
MEVLWKMSLSYELVKGSKLRMHTPCLIEAKCVLLSGKLPPWDPFHEQKLVSS